MNRNTIDPLIIKNEPIDIKSELTHNEKEYVPIEIFQVKNEIIEDILHKRILNDVDMVQEIISSDLHADTENITVKCDPLHFKNEIMSICPDIQIDQVPIPHCITSDKDIHIVDKQESSIINPIMVKMKSDRNESLTIVSDIKCSDIPFCKIPQFVCCICFTSFESEAPFVNHMMVHNSGNSCNETFTCDICGGKLTTTKKLLEHKSLHAREKQFPCTLCKALFKSNITLQRHLTEHTGIKAFTCNICNKGFSRKSDVSRHKLKHENGKLHTCEICNKEFCSMSKMVLHKFQHTISNSYQCDICKLRYPQENDLLQHKLIHNGGKMYFCDFCAKKFTAKSNFLRHRLTHTGEKPYQCDVCQKCFK